jgi:hypothetical protein
VIGQPSPLASAKAVPAPMKLHELAREMKAEAKAAVIEEQVIPAHSPTLDSRPSSPPRRSQCEDLEIKYNTARIFVEGMILPFDFRITPQVDEISDICIEIRCSDYARVSDQPPEEPTKDFTMPVHLAFRAPKGFPGGLVPFEIYVGYKLGGEQKWFVTRQIHTVHAAGENAGRAIENVKIEIQNQIDQGHAGDIHLNQDVSDYLTQMQSNHFDKSVEQLARFDLPEMWTTLAMHRCRKQSWQDRFFSPSRHGTPPPEACRTRITLHHPKARWHLLSETSYQLGRSRTESDIVTRFPGALHQQSAHISRAHCRIERTETSWRIVDGGYDVQHNRLKPSGLGTFVDSLMLDTEEGIELKPGRQYTLALGHAASSTQSPFSFEVDVLSWQEIRSDECRLLDRSGQHSQPPPALILRSPFMPDEVFILLWHILPIRRLDSRLHSLCLVRRTEAFQLCGPDQECSWLTPGQDLAMQRQSFSVSEYHQNIASKSRSGNR